MKSKYHNLLTAICFFLITINSCKLQNSTVIEQWDNGQNKKVHIIEQEKIFETNYFENGQIESKGFIIENNRESDWAFFYENGNIKKECFYKENIPFGLVENYFDNGMLHSKGKLNEFGLKDGKWLTFSRNGNLQSKGEYFNGKRINTWVSYFDNGSLKEEEILDAEGWIKKQVIYDLNGSDHRTVEYNNLQQIIREEFTVDSVNQKKLLRKFYPDGQLLEEGHIIDNYKVGHWMFWHPNGQRRAKGKFSDNINSAKKKFIKKKNLDALIDIEIKSTGIKEGNWYYWDNQGNKILEIEYLESSNIVKEIVKFNNLPKI